MIAHNFSVMLSSMVLHTYTLAKIESFHGSCQIPPTYTAEGITASQTDRGPRLLGSPHTASRWQRLSWGSGSAPPG